MTFDEFLLRERAYYDRMGRRHRTLANVGVPLLLIALGSVLLPLHLAKLALVTCVGVAVVFALYITISSRAYFADVRIRCPGCGRGVEAIYGTALEGAEFGEPIPATLDCPGCGRPITRPAI